MQRGCWKTGGRRVEEVFYAEKFLASCQKTEEPRKWAACPDLHSTLKINAKMDALNLKKFLKYWCLFEQPKKSINKELTQSVNSC